MIKDTFSLHDDELAVIYHGIFRSKLLERSIQPRAARHVCVDELKRFLEDAEITVFQSTYYKYLSVNRYIRLIRKEYFTFTAANIECFERLFIIECDRDVNEGDLCELASRLARKYFRKGKSPQPYVCFRNIDGDHLRTLKCTLFGRILKFFDGTNFDGDQFRLQELVKSRLNDGSISIKIVPEDKVCELLSNIKMDEVYQLFASVPLGLHSQGRHIRIQIMNSRQAIKMLA
jgi:hypothetical protein